MREALTTNNRMELTAVIRALEALKRPVQARIYTDSEYVRRGITEWVHELEGARLAHRRPQAGQEPGPVGAARASSAAGHQIEWHWVQGPCRACRVTSASTSSRTQAIDAIRVTSRYGKLARHAPDRP